MKKILEKFKKFFNEKEILLLIKTKLFEILKENEEELKEIANNKLDDITPVLKEKMVNLIVKNMKLKFPFSLFNGKIKKTAEKNFDKLVEAIKEYLK